MTSPRRLPGVLALLCSLPLSMPVAALAQAAGDAPPAGGPPHGPPPEAVAACQGKAVGTSASFTGRDGRTVAGPCTQMGDVVAVPPPRRGRGASAPDGR